MAYVLSIKYVAPRGKKGMVLLAESSPPFLREWGAKDYGQR